VATYPTSSNPSGLYRPSESFLANNLAKSKQTPLFTELPRRLVSLLKNSLVPFSELCSDAESSVVENLLADPRWLKRHVRTDQAVPRYELGELFFAHALGTGRAHREDHVADVRRAVVDGDLYVVAHL
jgi:hypothetical protein